MGRVGKRMGWEGRVKRGWDRKEMGWASVN